VSATSSGVIFDLVSIFSCSPSAIAPEIRDRV
jgi:hypothetical protein